MIAVMAFCCVALSVPLAIVAIDDSRFAIPQANTVRLDPVQQGLPTYSAGVV
jgi:hypothetical protein